MIRMERKQIYVFGTNKRWSSVLHDAAFPLCEEIYFGNHVTDKEEYLFRSATKVARLNDTIWTVMEDL